MRLTAIVVGSLAALTSPSFAQPTPTPTDPPAPIVPLPAPPAPTDQPIVPPVPDQPPPIVDQTTSQEQSTLGTITHYPPDMPGVAMYAWREPHMKSAIGISAIVGGGVTGFTDGQMRDVVQNTVGGLWDVRASIGTHIPIGLDLSYLGTSAGLKSLAGFDNGNLLGTTLEAAVRYNVLPHYAWNPYVFAGLGWQRYDVQAARFATSDTGLSNQDDALEIPMGAGLSYRRHSGFVGDLRGTFRAVSNPDLLIQTNGSEAELHTWEASAAVGYEF